MKMTQQKNERKGGQSSRKRRGWFGDSEGHAQAGRQSSGNRKGNRGRGRNMSIAY